MSSTEQMPLGFPALHYVEVQTARTVTGPLAVKVAHAADILALARPAKTVHVDNCAVGTYAVGYTRTPYASMMYLSWWYRVPPIGNPGDWLAVSLVITDGAANSVGPIDVRIPRAFQGVQTVLTLDALFSNPAAMTLGGEGWLNLTTLAGTLTDPDWTLTFTITQTALASAYVDRIEGWEVPAGTITDAATGVGALAGPLNPGNAVSAGSVSDAGWERIHATLQAAIAAPPEYLSLAWINDIGATIPKTSSATHAALTNFEESAGVPIVFRVRVRPMTVAAPPGTAAGEAARFRVLYWVAGGGSAEVRIHTGATGSPYAATGLTGASWRWSAWTACALPTDGTDQVARLTFDAKTSAGTVYLGAIVVEGVAP